EEARLVDAGLRELAQVVALHREARPAILELRRAGEPVGDAEHLLHPAAGHEEERTIGVAELPFEGELELVERSPRHTDGTANVVGNPLEETSAQVMLGLALVTSLLAHDIETARRFALEGGPELVPSPSR